MSNQHSPQEREVERWAPYRGDQSLHLHQEGQYVRYQDHRAAFQDREAELREAAQIAVEDQLRQRTKAEARANRAEAALARLDPFQVHLNAVLTRKQKEGKPTCADPVPDLDKLAALTEELGEVARALQDEPDNLRHELYDLATAAVLWGSSLDTSIGDREPEKCERCNGLGLKRQPDGGTVPTFRCPFCNGTGTKPPAPCKEVER